MKKSRFGLLPPPTPTSCRINSIPSFAQATYSISYQSVSGNVILSLMVFIWEVLWVTKHLLTSTFRLYTFIVCIDNWKVATCLFKLTGPSSSKNAAEFLFKNSLGSYLFFYWKMGEISVWSFWLLWKISGPPLLSPKVWPFLRTKIDWKMFKPKLFIYTQMHKKCLSWIHRELFYSSL